MEKGEREKKGERQGVGMWQGGGVGRKGSSILVEIDRNARAGERYKNQDSIQWSGKFILAQCIDANKYYSMQRDGGDEHQ